MYFVGQPVNITVQYYNQNEKILKNDPKESPGRISIITGVLPETPTATLP